jgi:hypothetical protein
MAKNQYFSTKFLGNLLYGILKRKYKIVYGICGKIQV